MTILEHRLAEKGMQGQPGPPATPCQPTAMQIARGTRHLRQGSRVHLLIVLAVLHHGLAFAGVMHCTLKDKMCLGHILNSKS